MPESLITNGLEIGATFLKSLAERCRHRGLTDEHLRYAFFHPAAEGLIVEQIADLITIACLPDRFILYPKIDYGKSPLEMIEAGNYDIVDLNVEFGLDAVQPSNVIDANAAIHFICFGKPMSDQEAVTGLLELNLRPAGPYELLTVGAAYPELQRRCPVAALNAKVKSPEFGDQVAIMSLNVSPDGRLRRLNGTLPADRPWLPETRFIAVDYPPVQEVA